MLEQDPQSLWLLGGPVVIAGQRPSCWPGLVLLVASPPQPALQPAP